MIPRDEWLDTSGIAVVGVSAAEVLKAAAAVLWPLVLALVVWRLLPEIKDAIARGEFTLKLAGQELTVRNSPEAIKKVTEAFEGLHAWVESLEKEVASLRADAAGGDAETKVTNEEPRSEEPLARALSTPRILWVDDNPLNHAFVAKTLREAGFEVVDAPSTQEGIAALLRVDCDLVITDLERNENGGPNPDAGLELIRELRSRHIEVPVVVYSSPRGVERLGEAARDAGALALASSPSELLTMLRVNWAATRFEASVERRLGEAGIAHKRVPVRVGVDFVVQRDGRRIGVEVKNWADDPSPERLGRTLERLRRAREALGLDEMLLVTHESVSLPPNPPLPANVRRVTPDQLAESLRSSAA